MPSAPLRSSVLVHHLPLTSRLEFLVSRFGRHVAAKQACRPALQPRMPIAEVPPGDGLNGGMGEKQGIEPGHFAGLAGLALGRGGPIAFLLR